MRRLGIAVMVFAVFAGIIKAEEEAAAPLAPPNYDYFEYAADSNKYLKDWTKFLSASWLKKPKVRLSLLLFQSTMPDYLLIWEVLPT